MKQRGFTLIELMVVIAIIGMLSSVVLASLSSAREKAASVRRISDLKTIQTALELYHSTNNRYPNLGWSYNCSGGNWATLQTALTPYLSAIPNDPTHDCAANRVYYVVTNSTDYKILAHIPPNAASAPRSLWDPARDDGNCTYVASDADCFTVDGNSNWAWAVYTPTAGYW